MTKGFKFNERVGYSMDKRTYRLNVQQQLEKMTYLEYCNRSQHLGKLLLNQDAIKEANTIAITLSNRPEVDTTFIIEQLWKMNKRVVVPKCTPEDRSMKFYAIESFAQTERAYKNILEPIPEYTELVEKEHIDTIVVPGVVFDPEGYRIGFGGGYYDRYLKDFEGTKISLAFNEQLVNRVPRASHDLPVHILITETECIVCELSSEEK